ncbi:MAG: ABC transporter substrate-binding protein, partial [Helicobacter sp.]|nr:ABC transporter substrate-binding protein [Helicobacter sp.]
MVRRRLLYLTNALLLSLQNLNAIEKTDFKTLKIGYLPITDHLLIIAKTLKNSNFTPVKFSSWADLSESLRAKSIDGAFILTPLALKLVSQKVKIKAILAAHRNGSALITKKGLIQEKMDINALKGLKIGIPSRFSTHYLLLANLLSLGNLT